MIRERYLKYIIEHHPEDYNENYRSFKLKDKLVNNIGTRVRFLAGFRPDALAVCRAHRGLPGGFLLLRYSVLFTVETLSLLYLLVIS